MPSTVTRKTISVLFRTEDGSRQSNKLSQFQPSVISDFSVDGVQVFFSSLLNSDVLLLRTIDKEGVDPDEKVVDPAEVVETMKCRQEDLEYIPVAGLGRRVVWGKIRTDHSNCYSRHTLKCQLRVRTGNLWRKVVAVICKNIIYSVSINITSGMLWIYKYYARSSVRPFVRLYIVRPSVCPSVYSPSVIRI